MLSLFARRSSRLTLSLIAFSHIAVACEGDCITGITGAFVGNYTAAVVRTFEAIGEKLKATILDPQRAGNKTASLYLQPLWDQYRKDAHQNMQTNVFKNYFHGKCQDPTTNIDPPGCPNPDCPVVCGTPGSLIHFYAKLRYLAFNSTARLLDFYVTSRSPAYQKVENAILADSKGDQKRGLRFRRQICHKIGECAEESLVKRSKESQIREIMQMWKMMVMECGGTQDGKLNGLPRCSWDTEMKPYILSFP